MKTGFQILGTVVLRVEREDGSVVESKVKNLVMKTGLTKVAGLIAGGTVALGLSHLAMGTSNDAPAETQTALTAETIRDAVTVTHQTGADSNKVEFKVSHALGTVTGTFKEAGLFNAASAGEMFNRAIFADFPVTPSDTLTVIWIIEVKNV